MVHTGHLVESVHLHVCIGSMLCRVACASKGVFLTSCRRVDYVQERGHFDVAQRAYPHGYQAALLQSRSGVSCAATGLGRRARTSEALPLRTLIPLPFGSEMLNARENPGGENLH